MPSGSDTHTEQVGVVVTVCTLYSSNAMFQYRQLYCLTRGTCRVLQSIQPTARDIAFSYTTTAFFHTRLSVLICYDTFLTSVVKTAFLNNRIIHALTHVLYPVAYCLVQLQSYACTCSEAGLNVSTPSVRFTSFLISHFIFLLVLLSRLSPFLFIPYSSSSILEYFFPFPLFFIPFFPVSFTVIPASVPGFSLLWPCVGCFSNSVHQYEINLCYWYL